MIPQQLTLLMTELHPFISTILQSLHCYCFIFTGIFDLSRIRGPDPSVDLAVDCPTIEVLKACGCNDGCIKPVKVAADGSCLFNSLSVALVGDESLAVELRLRACTAFIIHGNNIWQEGKVKGHHHTACGSLWEEITEMTTNFKAVSSYGVSASAKALGIGINVFYPPMNGATDKNIHIHGGLYGDKGAAHEVHLMWTSTNGAKKNPSSNMWAANHFVPLIRRVGPQAVVTIKSTSSADSVSTIASDLSIISLDDKTISIVEPVTKIKVQQLEEEEEIETITVTNCTDEFLSKVIPITAAISPAEAFQIIIDDKFHCWPHVPTGRKENIVFKVDNTENVQRRSRAEPEKLWCDRGPCVRIGNMKEHYILKSGKLVHVYCKKGIYSQSKQILNPQPKPDDIFVMRRYKYKLKDEEKPMYTRHCIFFLEAPDKHKEVLNTVVYQYLGEDPGDVNPPQGNAIVTTKSFKRCHPDTMDIARVDIKHQTPRKVYGKMSGKSLFQTNI
jgi:hypothetical protein